MTATFPTHTTPQRMPTALDAFVLPPGLEATAPPEYRGLLRDQVPLMVLDRRIGATQHTRFNQIGEYLRAGDLLVVNASRTIPALLPAIDEEGKPVEVRIAHRRKPNEWDAIILEGRRHVGRVGMHLSFRLGDTTVMTADVLRRRADLLFMFRLRFSLSGAELLDTIYRIGEPVRYYYIDDVLPLDLYQTVYATVPGSVEMPSAGRAFSWQLLSHLQQQGIGLTSLILHTGLSSTRDDDIDALHPNYDEEYHIPAETAETINRTRASGGRIIAVGTTVVRALETVATDDGTVSETHGWTRLHVGPQHKLRAVDGLLTGFHEPSASHLDLLQAFIDPDLLYKAYQEAIERKYLWHEFGDMNLII